MIKQSTGFLRSINRKAMKKIYIEKIVISLVILICSVTVLYSQNITATEIIKKADDKFNGEKSVINTMVMTIVRPSWERKVEFKSWSVGRENSLTLITAPAKDQGQTFLKRGQEMWSFNPAINRLIKLPPSMMSQGWMGSDYTNDDILKESSVVKDYTHEIVGEEIIGGRNCYKINMVAKPDAAIVWGHQMRWIDKKDMLTLKVELYDEDGSLVRTEWGSDIKIMDSRTIPARLELIPSEEKGNKTIIEIKDIKFNVAIEDSFFSQQNMKRIR
jgi:outer membrane lipoprotein-sorting protein